MWRHVFDRAPGHLHRLVCEVGETFVEILFNQLTAILKFHSGEFPPLWNCVPVLQTRATATRCCVLGVEYRIPVHGCLSSITWWIGGRQIFPHPISRRFLELQTAFAMSVALRHIVNVNVKEVMPYELVLKRLEGVSGVGEIALVQAIPINQISTAGAALSALVRGHFFELLETVKIVHAIR
jgi:hypothetical protein